MTKRTITILILFFPQLSYMLIQPHFDKIFYTCKDGPLKVMSIMASRNILKTYVENSYYHIYNRGVAKQKIFLDKQDYEIFTKYLKESLTEPPARFEREVLFTLQGRTFKGVARLPKNFKDEIELNAFCLMPNHFHILIKQNNKVSMLHFMRSVITRFAQYFNKKYDRVGPVFQGRYKAIMVENDRYLLHLSRYIHLNPSEYTKDLTKAYSSYSEYLGLRKTDWIKPDIILKFFNSPVNSEFKKINSYKNFVESYEKDSSEVLGNLILE